MTDAARRGARGRWAWAALALLAFALRAWGLAAQGLWSDEDITLDRARLPLAELLARLPVEHPPGYFALLAGWTRLAGDGDYALRFPSLAAGVLAVPLGGYIAARLAGRRAGWVAGLLLAVNPFLVWYGQEARMYAQLGTLALAALACVLRAERAARPGPWWLAAGAAAAATVTTHYYGAVLVLVLAAWAALDLARWGRTALRGWLLAGLAAGLLFLPWLPRAWAALGFPGGRAFLFQGDLWAVLAAWSASASAGPWAGPIAALYLGLAALGLAVLGRRAGRGRDLGALRALLYLAVPVLAMAGLVWHTRDFHPRYFFAALPALYLAVAAGAAALPRPAAMLAVAALALAALPPLANLHGDPRYQKQDLRAMLRTVEAAAGHEDTVLFLDGPSLGLTRRYEVDDSPVKIVNLREDAGEPPAERVAARAQELAGEFRHLWLAENGAANGDIRRWLDAHAYPVGEQGFQDITLSRYLAAPPAGDALDRDRDAAPAGADAIARCPRPLCLRPIAIQGPVHAGDIVPVDLFWEPRVPLTRTYKVSLRLRPGGQPAAPPVGAVDRPPTNGRIPTTSWVPGQSLHDRHGFLVPAGTPPGRYGLHALLYDAETGAELGTWDLGWFEVLPP